MNPNRVAIVTGAARGIGAATAVELARDGCDVALVDRDEQGLRETRRAVESLDRSAAPIVGDLADLRFVESIVPLAMERFARVDVLVNNAAWREIVTMRHISVESWERTLRVCLTAPAFLARWAAEAMQRQPCGVIVNISSMMSRQAAGSSPAYVACKGALESLTYELAALYGPAGIRVVAIAPGAIDTELSRDYPTSTSDPADDPMRAFSEEMISLGRWGKAEEIGRLVAALASDSASYVTGAVIEADGGWRHQHLPLSLRRRQFPRDFP